MIAFDTETFRIRPGRLAPPLVCLSWWASEGGKLLSATEAEGFIVGTLAHGEQLVGHNVAFDLAVLAAHDESLLPLIFDALQNDQITDTGIRQKLIDIAVGVHKKWRDPSTGKVAESQYSLATLVKRHFGEHLEKEDTWRLRYEELAEVPIAAWPAKARQYAQDDAMWTYKVWEAQEGSEYLKDQYRQTRAAWWLHLMSCHGLRTNAAAIDELSRNTQATYDEAMALCKEHGLVRSNGTRDTKKTKVRMESACASLGVEPKRTDKGGISLDEEACTTVNDSVLEAYSRVSSLMNVIKNQIPQLRNGLVTPIQPSYDSLIATGRTAVKGYSDNAPTNGYQIQNVRRLPGIRECFHPRDGHWLLGADYDGMELKTWAQVCMWVVGFSKLGEAINSGKDPHAMLGADLLGLEYEEMKEHLSRKDKSAKDGRQFAKVGNFGFQGGMGVNSFRNHAREQYRMYKTEAECHVLREKWRSRWSENYEYFEWINSQLHCDLADVKHFRSDRHRGQIRYTVACNTFFQGLAADAIKHAGFHIARECYVEKDSPLYGCRPVIFAHDEFILEVPASLSVARPAAARLVEVMCARAGEWLPDVPPTASPTLMTHWSKNADPVFDDTGELVPWTG